jgi:hypothetical protein
MDMEYGQSDTVPVTEPVRIFVGEAVDKRIIRAPA